MCIRKPNAKYQAQKKIHTHTTQQTSTQRNAVSLLFSSHLLHLLLHIIHTLLQPLVLLPSLLVLLQRLPAGVLRLSHRQRCVLQLQSQSLNASFLEAMLGLGADADILRRD